MSGNGKRVINLSDGESENDDETIDAVGTPKKKRKISKKRDFNNYKHKYKKTWENKFSWLSESKQGTCHHCL